MAYHPLRIVKIVQETSDARSFVLEVPPELAERFRYKAGQFLTFRVPHGDGVFNRCYSLSSAPETDGMPKVTVKRVEGGKGSNWFHDALTEGTVIDVMPPAGVRREHVLLERFEASGNDAVPVEAPEAGDVVPDHITIHFEGKTHRVPYQKGQTILVAARAAGLNPLSSCEEGFCASCAAKRIKGKIVLAKNDIYTPDDLANNWILTCQGHCFGPEAEITYDVV